MTLEFICFYNSNCKTLIKFSHYYVKKNSVTFLGRQRYSFGGLLRSRCLSVCCLVLCGQTMQYRPLVCIESIRHVGTYLDWYHFRPPKSTLTHQMGVEQIELNFVLAGLEKSWVGFILVRIPTCQHSPNIQNWGSSNSPFKLWPKGSRWSNTLN